MVARFTRRNTPVLLREHTNVLKKRRKGGVPVFHSHPAFVEKLKNSSFRRDIGMDGITRPRIPFAHAAFYTRSTRVLAFDPNPVQSPDTPASQPTTQPPNPVFAFAVAGSHVFFCAGYIDIDIGIDMDTREQLEFRGHHRWRLKPNFKPGDPCYNDRPPSENTVTGLPDKLRGVKLMQIVTAQVKKEESCS